MKEKLHKIVFKSICGIVLSAFLLSPCIALADSDPGGSGDFTIQNNVLVKYNGSGGDVAIPNTVTEIGNGAFGNCASLTNITIPDSVKKIDSEAFYGCTGLTSLTIPDSVTSADYWAFNGCTGLTSVTISKNLTLLSGLFVDCTGLTSVTIPEGVQTINYTFSGCSNLSSVTIPDSVTDIANNTFENCVSLKSINLPKNLKTIEGAFPGCTALTQLTIPDGVVSITDNAFQGCKSLTEITIPKSVTFIDDHMAFRDATPLIICPSGSYAASYAANHAMACKVDNTVTLYSDKGTGYYASLLSSYLDPIQNGGTLKVVLGNLELSMPVAAAEKLLNGQPSVDIHGNVLSADTLKDIGQAANREVSVLDSLNVTVGNGIELSDSDGASATWTVSGIADGTTHVYYYDTTAKKLVPVTNEQVSAANNMITFNIQHLSDYAVIKEGSNSAPSNPKTGSTSPDVALLISGVFVSGAAILVLRLHSLKMSR